ncbi:MAG TPA: hypothetical protein VG318_18610 [Actinomycetota bacterium]|nr:hypothetical protein [Actinomycetota bacterium]
MRAATAPDFFDRARLFAAAGLVLAGLCGIAGSVLDWAVITEREVAEGVDFGESAGEIEPGQGEPFSGVEARDGWFTLVAGLVTLMSGVVLVVTKRGGYAWLAFWASVVTGGIAFADYRGLGDVGAAISQRMEVGAEARPGIGLTLVAVAAMLGLISAVGGVAATPRVDR